MKSNSLKSLKDPTIEQHTAWCGKLSLREISFLLSDQKPFTYVLSEFSNHLYLLSYVKGPNHETRHIPFKKIRIKQNGHVKNGYRNCTNIIFSTVESLIRYKLKGKGILPELPPLKLRA